MPLSGGERQRIALARAFLKGAPVLLLDEPTNSVDVGTEAGIMQALEDLTRGRTTFPVAHRIATLEECEVLLRFEDDGLVHVVSNSAPALAALSHPMRKAES